MKEQVGIGLHWARQNGEEKKWRRRFFQRSVKKFKNYEFKKITCFSKAPTLPTGMFYKAKSAVKDSPFLPQFKIFDSPIYPRSRLLMAF